MTEPSGAQASRETVVIAFDGSPAARRAIEEAAKVFRSSHVLVVTIWEEGLAYARLRPPSMGWRWRRWLIRESRLRSTAASMTTPTASQAKELRSRNRSASRHSRSRCPMSVMWPGPSSRSRTSIKPRRSWSVRAG